MARELHGWNCRSIRRTQSSKACRYYRNLKMKKCGWWYEGQLLGEGNRSGIVPSQSCQIMCTTGAIISEVISERESDHGLPACANVVYASSIEELETQGLLEGLRHTSSQVFSRQNWRKHGERAECLYGDGGRGKLQFSVAVQDVKPTAPAAQEIE